MPASGQPVIPQRVSPADRVRGGVERKGEGGGGWGGRRKDGRVRFGKGVVFIRKAEPGGRRGPDGQ